MGVEDYIQIVGAALLGGAIAKAYFSELKRRYQFKNYLEYFMTAETEKKPVDLDKDTGNLGSLVRVFWDEDILGYKTEEGRPLELTPLKTIPLNFHWSWVSDFRTDFQGNRLLFGLRTHIQEEGIKQGADAYFLSHMVSGHGNPMYALTYFRKQKKA